MQKLWSFFVSTCDIDEINSVASEDIDGGLNGCRSSDDLIIHKNPSHLCWRLHVNLNDRFSLLGKYVEDSNYTYWLYVTVYYPLVATFLLPCVFVFLIYFSSVTLYIFKFHRWITVTMFYLFFGTHKRFLLPPSIDGFCWMRFGVTT